MLMPKHFEKYRKKEKSHDVIYIHIHRSTYVVNGSLNPSGGEI